MLIRRILFVVLIAPVLMGCRSRSQCHTACDFTGPCVPPDFVAPESPPPVGEPHVPAAPKEAVKEVPAVVTLPDTAVEVKQLRPLAPPPETIETDPLQVSVDPEPAPRYGKGPNMEWLIGNLQRSNMPDRQWHLRFAPIDQLEVWGGSAVLIDDNMMQGFQDGDHVKVEGEVYGDRASMYSTGPRYRVLKIELLDRATNEI